MADSSSLRGLQTASSAATRGMGPTRLVLAVATVGAVAILSPWKYSHLPFSARMLELGICGLAWEALSVSCARSAAAWVGSARLGRSSMAEIGALLAASLPAAAAVMIVLWAFGERIGAPGLCYGETLLLGLLITFARRGLTQGWRAPATVRDAAPLAAGLPAAVPPDEPPPCPAVAFMRRHAPKLVGSRLLALEAEDHYLRIHTDGGTAMVLMRLRDAIASLDGVPGWQPHRSFWITSDVDARAERHGQGWRLVLPNGLVVPVSRANASRLRDGNAPPCAAGRPALDPLSRSPS